MFNSGGGANLRSLLCFIPGLDRRSTWNPNNEINKLVRTLSREDIETVHLSNSKIRFYGSGSSSESDEEADAVHRRPSLVMNDMEDSNCPPAFLMLAPREDNSEESSLCNDNQSLTRKIGVAQPPQIVIHPVSQESEVLTDPQKRSGKRRSSLLPVDSFENMEAEAESPEEVDEVNGVARTRSASTWVSPMASQRPSITSDTSLLYDSSSKVTDEGVGSAPSDIGEGDDTVRIKCTCALVEKLIRDHRVSYVEGSLSGDSYSDISTIIHSDSCSTCFTSRSPSITSCIYHGPNAQEPVSSRNSRKVEVLDECSKVEVNPLFKTCNASNDSTLEESGHLDDSIDKPVSDAPYSNSDCMLNGDDTMSCSTDSRSLSYVSAPRRISPLTSETTATHTEHADWEHADTEHADSDSLGDESEASFWFRDADSGDVTSHISREVSAHTLKQEEGPAVVEPVEPTVHVVVVEEPKETPAVVNSSPNRLFKGFGNFVQQLVGKPATKTIVPTIDPVPAVSANGNGDSSLVTKSANIGVVSY